MHHVGCMMHPVRPIIPPGHIYEVWQYSCSVDVIAVSKCPKADMSQKRSHCQQECEAPADLTGCPERKKRRQMTLSSQSEFIGEKKAIKRVEYVRILQQALTELGHPQLADGLAQASSCVCEESSVVKLRQHIVNGEWLPACEAATACTELTSDQLSRVKYVLMQQHVLESIATKQYAGALQCIRTKMQPLGVFTAELHELAGCLVCENTEELMLALSWHGPTEMGRRNVLQAVQNIVPPNVMIPPGRLLSLIEQSLQAQGSVTDCYDNCIQTRTSLFFDATSSIDCLPISCTQTLNEHKDQVLSVAFSPDGCWLASCCQDGLVGFWKVNLSARSLQLHTMVPCGYGAVHTMAWSADSTSLVAVCDKSEAAPGAVTPPAPDTVVLQCQPGSPSPSPITTGPGSINAVVWTLDGKHIVSVDRGQHLCIAEVDQGTPGCKYTRWKPGRMHDIAVSPDGKWYAITFGQNVKLFKADELLTCSRTSQMNDAEVASFQPSDIAFNVAFSADSKYLLMDIKDRSVIICEIIVSKGPELPKRTSSPGPSIGSSTKKTEPQANNSVKLTLRHRLHPPSFTAEQDGFRIKPVFGGKNCAFVAMGSVRGEVRLWHWSSEKYLCGLEGHSEACNSVAWHPTDPHMLVSASDDCSVRVWTSPIVKDGQ